jgi:hypothetical protein
MKKLIFALTCLFLAVPCQARVITVDDDEPADFNTIQAAIDDSNDGDTIIVADGIYTGNGNRDIDFRKYDHGLPPGPTRAITVRSANGPGNCIIDCNGTESDPHGGFRFENGEDSNSVIMGFTIINGFARCESFAPPFAVCEYLGGAIYCWRSSPTISNCIISGNTARYGGGIACYKGNPTVSNCIFVGNCASDGGGMGILNGSDAKIINCTFSGNVAYHVGGGILNGSIMGQVEPEQPKLINCILWGNSPDEINVSNGTPVITYSNVVGGWAGDGNIDVDPCFIEPGHWEDPCNTPTMPWDDIWIHGDYHLQSQAGRWNTNSQSWVQDDVSSLCIDAGDPNSDWTAELWPHGKRINMGAYGGTPQASMSQLDIGNIANLDNDVNDIVNSLDLALFVGKWCYEEFLLAEDLSRDGFVNFIDFAIFANNCEQPPLGPLPSPVSNLEPANGATEVDPNADLSWTASLYAVSYDVFFGMSNPPPFIHNQTSTTFDPGTMGVGAKHYWRIDAVNGWGTTTGTVWSFTTLVPAHSATNPNPYDGQAAVSTTPVLSWTADPDATSHDVYFGTNYPPTFIRNQPATTFEPSTLEMTTTYYWRIDEVGAYGTITGVIWSFRTMGPGPG